MSEEPKAQVQIRDFPGLRLEIDEYDMGDGGSHDQVNAVSIDPGSISSRHGYRLVTFDGE